MTDLHSHILHGIDDGPSKLDESVELCRIAYGNNVSQIVVTPHLADFSAAGDFFLKREEKMRELKDALERQGVNVSIFPGAEVLVSDEIYYTDALERFTINQSRYILVEFPYSGLSFHTLARYIAEIKSRRLIPIIAHPERYVYFQRNFELVDFLLHEGILLQVNAGSLCRGTPRTEHRLAWKIIKTRSAAFLATDAHSVDLRPGSLLDMLLSLPREIDSEYMTELVDLNPDAVLHNRDIAFHV